MERRLLLNAPYRQQPPRLTFVREHDPTGEGVVADKFDDAVRDVLGREDYGRGRGCPLLGRHLGATALRHWCVDPPGADAVHADVQPIAELAESSREARDRRLAR